MVSRIYVEKKPGFDVEAQQLKSELTGTLGIEGLTGLRLINRYDVEGIDEGLSSARASARPFAPQRFTSSKVSSPTTPSPPSSTTW